MKIFRKPEELAVAVKAWKQAGEKIGLVPTMGCLHEGHVSLVRRSIESCSVTVATIFVNPAQFGPNEDFNSYPRQLDADCKLLEKEGVDAIFCPEPDSMYPQGYQTRVVAGELSRTMCGGSRPGHFDGVVTVVAKLFNISQADCAFFGEKDFQQLTIIRKMVEDLNFPVEVIGCPIVREKDGLAMSSRNKYLTPDTRMQALCLYKSIQNGLARVAQSGPGLASAEILEDTARIVGESDGELDYAVIIDEKTLEPVETIREGTVIALAVRIANTVRLIDNAKLL